MTVSAATSSTPAPPPWVAAVLADLAAGDPACVAETRVRAFNELAAVDVGPGGGKVQAASGISPSGEAGSRQSERFLYAGQYRDSESGLYLMGARYYDPATAQWLTRDPAAAMTRSPYGYAGGDPIDHIDPSGLWYAAGPGVGATTENDYCSNLATPRTSNVCTGTGYQGYLGTAVTTVCIGATVGVVIGGTIQVCGVSVTTGDYSSNAGVKNYLQVTGGAGVTVAEAGLSGSFSGSTSYSPVNCSGSYYGGYIGPFGIDRDAETGEVTPGVSPDIPGLELPSLKFGVGAHYFWTLTHTWSY